MRHEDGRDHRRNSSAELVLKVEYDPSYRLPADYLTDLDEEGLFLCTKQPFEIGRILAFTLSFPGLLAGISLRGVVDWLSHPEEDNPDAPQGVGIRFLYRVDGERRAIRDVLGRLEASRTHVREPKDRLFRVLLVEDNEFAHKLFLHAVKRYHGEFGEGTTLEIIGARDGKEALELLARSPIDLAVVDFFLPVMSGGVLIERMRRNPRYAHTPILVISVGGDGVRDEAMAAGADLYLDKPVLLKQLVTTLAALIGGAPGAREATREEQYS